MCACTSKETKYVKIDEYIEKMIFQLEYQECYLLKLGDYSNCQSSSITVNRQDVKNAMYEYVKQHPVEVKTDKAVIEEGDLVRISYKILDSSEVLLDVPDEVVLAGRTNFDSLIEDSLIGRNVGQVYSIQYHNSNLETVNAHCVIVPKYIYTLSEAELNDEFVRNKIGYDSIVEWENAIQAELLEQKQESAWSAVLADIIKNSSFELDRQVILEKAADLAYQTELQATLEGQQADMYIQQTLGMSKEEFYNECYTSCQFDIQEYLVIGAIAVRERIEVKEQELQEYYKKQGLSIENLVPNEEVYAHYYVLRNKVISHVCLIEDVEQEGRLR